MASSGAAAAAKDTVSGDLPIRRPSTTPSNFDIVSTYHKLLESDPDLTNLLLAIESLIDLLNTVPSTTSPSKGWRFVGEGKCVLTHGASRSVTGLLERAAKSLNGKFKVVYVRDGTRVSESDGVVKELRQMGIPVAEVPEAAVAHVMGLLRQVHMVIVGAEAVTQNGGIISRIGTYQIAQLASKAKIPFYVAAETHKFVRKFPLDQRDIGFKQHVLDFSTDSASKQPENAVDYTVSVHVVWEPRDYSY
ncbi:translation initiation factor eIF-2B subunit alpha [Metarhizium acridum]|nr:translation initiation factor eIF-2B subunit alpha [Metarhizium acridum]